MKTLLNFEILGNKNSDKKVVITHGLFGSLKNWRSIARKLASGGFQVIICDTRNHGLSFWDDSHTYEDLAGDLRSLIIRFGGVATIIGHSMGGKAAMTLALLHPECVGKLVVVDIAPVTYQHNQLDYIHAMESVNLDLVKTRKEFSKQLSYKIEDPMLRDFFSQNVNFSDHGRVEWFLNLSALKKNLSSIMGFPNLKLRSLSQTLILRGAISDYVLDEYRPVFKTYFPNFKLETIQNAGHWLHVEKRTEFQEKLINFLLN